MTFLNKQSIGIEEAINVFSMKATSRLLVSNDITPSFESELWYRHNEFTSTALVLAYGLVFIIGLIGNILVIITVARGGRLVCHHSVTDIFLANLAVADLLVIIACLPFTLVSHLINPWVLGTTICKLLPFLQGVSVCSSVYSLVAVAVERCRTVTAPLSQRMTTRTCRIIIALIWIVAALITSPWLVVFKQYQLHSSDENSVTVCSEVWPEPWMGFTYFFVIHLTLCYIVPLLVIVVSYVLVGYHIWRRQILSSNPSADDEVERQTRQLQQTKLRALRMVAIVVAAFALAWLPLYATVTRLKLSSVLPNWTIPTETEISLWSHVIPIAQWMSSANSCINPFIYHFLDSRFRTRFRQLLRPRIQRRMMMPLRRSSILRTCQQQMRAQVVAHSRGPIVLPPASTLNRSICQADQWV